MPQNEGRSTIIVIPQKVNSVKNFDTLKQPMEKILAKAIVNATTLEDNGS